ncbi:MAG: ABC transporter ATP-binding protein [Bacteroidota bacterium]|nr:ABC transporter ATP-binding protein [Bacteroidota bacterium]
MPPTIAFEEVRFAYGTTSVLHALSFHVAPGEFIGVIGPNGAGKTTVLRLMTGLLRPTSGAVRIDGRRVQDIPAPERARLLAVVPQNERVAFPHTVEAMVLLGRFPHTSGLGYENETDRMAAARAMERVGIARLASRGMDELSGGEQHRVFIARALAQDTPVLLLDEPNAHLDLRHQAGLFELLAHLHRDEGRSILIITHDLNLAGMYCDRILLLSDGKSAAWGTPAEVLREDLLTQHFGVHVQVDPGPRPHVRLLRTDTAS